MPNDLSARMLAVDGQTFRDFLRAFERTLKSQLRDSSVCLSHMPPVEPFDKFSRNWYALIATPVP